MARLSLLGITTFGFLLKEFILVVLGIPALFVEKFAYCEIRIGMEFLKGCGLDFLGLIQTQIQQLTKPKALEGKDDIKSPGLLL